MTFNSENDYSNIDAQRPNTTSTYCDSIKTLQDDIPAGDKADLASVCDSGLSTNSTDFDSITPTTFKKLSSEEKKVFMRMNPAEFVVYANMNSEDIDVQSLA